MPKAHWTKAGAATIAYLLLVHITWGQQSQIKGKIAHIEEHSFPVIHLMAAADSGMVKATVCEIDGSFTFDRLNKGLYFISVREMGYQPYNSNVISLPDSAVEFNLPDIFLTRTSQEIKEVQVRSIRPFVQRKIDRIIVDPSALISNSGSTVLDVLQKAPGVMVDNNDNISMKGKPGVMVFIDDKPTYLASSDLANYLRSLPSDAVESVELISNPPARYDAAGNAGIINIRLKKNATKGINGGINLSYGQGKYARTNNSLNINYRINKFNFFANIGLNQNNSYQDLTINRYYYNTEGAYKSGFKQNSYIKRNMGGANARVGMDYYMSDRSVAGITLAGFYNPQKSTITNYADIQNAYDQTEMLIQSLSPSDRRWKNGAVNANYSLKLDNKGREITANADYITYNSKQGQSLENRSYSPAGQFLEKSLLRSSLPSDIVILSAKVDYSHPIAGIGKIDAGAKFSNVKTNNDAQFFDVVNGISTPNNEFSNKFRYKENIGAGYVNYSKEWKKFSLQLGLRLEHTQAEGHQLGNTQAKDSSFHFQYTSLFPTLFLLYKADSALNHQFGFAFGRRIERPDYQDLNPFTYPMDRYTFYAGNPFLQPTFSYNLELSYTYKNAITTTFEYGIAHNLIQETNEQRGTIYYSRPGNFGRQQMYGFSLNGSLPIVRWWTLQLYAECKNVSLNTTIYGQPLVEARWFGHIGPVNQFLISEKWSAEIGGFYQTAVLSGQFLTIPVWQAHAGLAYRMWKGQGTIKLNLSDIFYTNQPGGDIRNIAQSKANWLSYLDTRVATLSFSYRFNKGKGLQARQTGASDTEKGRVR